MTSDDDDRGFSLKAAIERANQDFAESPDWLREIHRRNRELTAFLDERAHVWGRPYGGDHG